MKTRFTLALAFVALLVFGLAGTSVANHSWNNYHWARTTSSFNLPVIDSVSIEWQTQFEQALSMWDKASAFDNVVVSADDSSKTRKRCPATSGHMRVCNASYGQNGWLGLASINLDSNGHIVQGTAKMNDSYDYYFAATPGEDNHVICQEIGHVYGLAHTSEDGSSQSTCMDYSTSLNSQWPNNHDFQQLSDIYSHLDSYDSYATGGGGGGGGGCNSPPGKGCNKAGFHDGVPLGAVRVHYTPGHDGHLGHADYVLPDGNDGLWLFHLTLIPEDFPGH